MTLSFICTVRNGERYVNDTIESIVTHHPNAECIIVDDGSTDGTTAILERWRERHPGIQVLSPGRVGRGRALNIAVQACSRPYIANMDADDLAVPGRNLLIEHLEESGPDVALAAGRSMLIHGDKAWDPQSQLGHLPEAPLHVTEVGCRLHRGNPLSHIAVVMRREALLSIGGYNETRKSQLDFDLWARLANRGYRLHRLNLVVAVKRLHEAQSFEAGNNLLYVLRGAPVRFLAARSPSRRVVAVAVLFPQVLWACIPRRLRITLMKTAVVHRTRAWLREGRVQRARVTN